MADLSRWKILIVEDDLDARELLVPVLKQVHATVLTAATADEAMDRFKMQHPNLALVDLALPGTDGWELLDIVRRDHAYDDVTLIAMTAFDFPEVGEEALESGFKAYIPKPINLRTFVDDLLKLIG
jgi:CheY-like chemotaxis protein